MYQHGSKNMTYNIYQIIQIGSVPQEQPETDEVLTEELTEPIIKEEIL